jgi:hypothetical protein
LTRLRKAVLKGLDSGSDIIALNFYGSGHGSKTSVCLSLTVVIGFLAFLVIFNIFSFNTTVTAYKLIASNDFSYDFA